MNKKFLKITMALAAVVLLTACQSPAEKAIEKTNEKILEKSIESSMGGDAKVDIDEGSVDVKTETGSIQSGGDLSLPGNFPSDVYVYEGKLATVISNEEKNSFNLTIETKDSLEDIRAAYDEEFEKEGWTANQMMNLGEALYLGAEKDGRALTIVANALEDKTMITLNIEDK